MFSLDHFIGNVENITFIDIGENPQYPTEIIVSFNPELYSFSLRDLDSFEDYLVTQYDNFSIVYKDDILIISGIIRITPLYPSDMSDSVRKILAQTLKTETHNFILSHSIRLQYYTQSQP